MECLLCLNSYQDVATCVLVDSIQWQEFSIKKLIDKYMWPIEPVTSRSCLCSTCWIELNNFHKFYTHIDDLHNSSNNKWVLTAEMDPLEEDIKPKGFLMEGQLEMEIEFGQKLLMSTIIKQENEEFVVAHNDYGDKDNEIHLSMPDDPHTFIYESCPEVGEVKCDNLYLTNMGSKEETFTQAKSKPNDGNDKAEIHMENSAKPHETDTTEDKNNNGRKLYKVSKINREDYDDFLKEHFKITCDKCQVPFERFRLLSQHYKREHNEQGFVTCCETKFFNRMQLVDHINLHLNPEYFKCVYCAKVFPRRTYLLDHIMKVHEEKRHRCDKCGKKFLQRCNLEKHILRHLQKSQKNLQCNDGETSSKSKPGTKSIVEDIAEKSLKIVDTDTPEDTNNAVRKLYHLSNMNSEEHDAFIKEHFNITCVKCDEPCETFHLLSRHCRKDHSEPGFVVCCEKKLLSRMQLFDHINYHLNPEYFKCVHCDKVFAQRTYLLDHIKFHEEKKYGCDVCDKKFVREKILEKHKLLIHGEKTIQCKDCGKFYVSEAVLSQHQRQHHLNVYATVCDICGQTFADKISLKRHMEKQHDLAPDTSVKCDECGLIVKTPKTLKLHKELKHPVGGRRDYNCHICKKVSTSLRALKRHIVEVHETDYKYKCTVCEKEFKRTRCLQSHMATHTGIPLYTCPWCPKQFNSNGNYHKHRQLVHPIEWEKEVRKKYSGNLPPNFKRSPSTYNSQRTPLPIDTIQE